MQGQDVPATAKALSAVELALAIAQSCSANAQVVTVDHFANREVVLFFCVLSALSQSCELIFFFSIYKVSCIYICKICSWNLPLRDNDQCRMQWTWHVHKWLLSVWHRILRKCLRFHRSLRIKVSQQLVAHTKCSPSFCSFNTRKCRIFSGFLTRVHVRILQHHSWWTNWILLQNHCVKREPLAMKNAVAVAIVSMGSANVTLATTDLFANLLVQTVLVSFKFFFVLCSWTFFFFSFEQLVARRAYCRTYLPERTQQPGMQRTWLLRERCLPVQRRILWHCMRHNRFILLHVCKSNFNLPQKDHAWCWLIDISVSDVSCLCFGRELKTWGGLNHWVMFDD